MKLTLIEAHHHHEVLLWWIPLCVRTNWSVNVVTSTTNWNNLEEIIPEDCGRCNFSPLPKVEPFPRTDLIVFTTIQTTWHKWLQLTKQHPSALVVHNANMYFRPHSNFASRQMTEFSLVKHTLKWLYEIIYGISAKKDFLKNQDFVLPYSNTQLPYFRKHCKQKVMAIPTIYKREIATKKVNDVIIPLYKRVHHIDIPFFKKCLSKYESPNYHRLKVICSREEFTLLQTYFQRNEKVDFLEHPLRTQDYYTLVQSSQYMCLPFHQETVFNIYREFIGITKYSGRMKDAIEFGCTPHMPDYIPLEAPQLPTLDEASKEMGRKLDEMYQNAHS